MGTGQQALPTAAEPQVQMRANTAFVLGLIEHNCLLLSHGVRVDGTGVGACLGVGGGWKWVVLQCMLVESHLNIINSGCKNEVMKKYRHKRVH